MASVKSRVRLALKWLVLSVVVAALTGTAAAVFLAALAWATHTREAHLWLLALLPVAGWAVAAAYERWGQRVQAGNNLLIEEVHVPTQTIPLRMAPMVLVGTVVSHLFGASVGREGTAVQVGGTLADQVAAWCHLDVADRQCLIMAGIGAGFAAVFGTPWAGAIFALEVLTIGRLRWQAGVPCLLAALLANQVCTWWGLSHAHYSAGSMPAWSVSTVGAALVLGGLAGLLAMAFARGTHALSGQAQRWWPHAPTRAAWGGGVLAVVIWVTDAWAYAGLSLPGLAQAFEAPVAAWDFAAKGILTMWSLAVGFKGGEVTPLFYMGATLGNALAPWLQQPFAWLAALGFVAVLAGAANTPLACTVMAIELFGWGIGGHAALTCIAAYWASGHRGIYSAQRVGRHKYRRHG